MITIDNVDVYGWIAAIRGARNPMNSWNQSDTSYGTGEKNSQIGPRDLRLLRNLAQAGPDHGKYLRMITVTVDITAPFYWWKEFDTYKVGTVANSCSTMHKIHTKPIELSDFCFDDPDTEIYDMFSNTITDCEYLRQKYLETGDKKYWRALIQLLPCSYLQRRTVLLNYAVLRAMYHARKNHKLKEWHVFCAWVRTLPYSELITGEDTNE